LAQTDAVLVDGSPPLTQAMLDKCLRFWAWALAVGLSDSQAAAIRDQLLQYWTSHDQAAIDQTLQRITTIDQIEQADPATQAYWRELNQAAVVNGLQHDSETNNTVAASLLQAYQAANRPLVPGDPPLTLEVTNALLDLGCFLHANGTQATDKVRLEWSRQVARSYVEMSTQQRQTLSQMPLVWANVQAVWEKLAPAEQDAYRAQWLQKLGGLLNQITGDDASTQPVARRLPSAAGPLGLGGSAFSSGGLLGGVMSGGGSPFDQALQTDAWLRQKEEADAQELEQVDPRLATQKRMQDYQNRVAFYSNLGHMSYQIGQSIIGNMR
jgi:hypothetical protein